MYINFINRIWKNHVHEIVNECLNSYTLYNILDIRYNKLWLSLECAIFYRKFCFIKKNLLLNYSALFLSENKSKAVVQAGDIINQWIVVMTWPNKWVGCGKYQHAFLLGTTLYNELIIGLVISHYQPLFQKVDLSSFLPRIFRAVVGFLLAFSAVLSSIYFILSQYSIHVLPERWLVVVIPDQCRPVGQNTEYRIGIVY